MRDEPDYSEDHQQELIENEMHNYAQDVRWVVGKVMHPKYVDDFIVLLANSFFEEDCSAVRLADGLGLSLLDLLAIKGDYACFKELYLKEVEDRIGEVTYDSMQ